MNKLIVYMRPDTGPAQADLDLALAKEGAQVTCQNASELYFLQLRLRIAEDPLLAHLVEVHYTDDSGSRIVPLTGNKDECMHWPPGFLSEAWDLVIKTQAAYSTNWRNKDEESETP